MVDLEGATLSSLVSEGGGSLRSPLIPPTRPNPTAVIVTAPTSITTDWATYENLRKW